MPRRSASTPWRRPIWFGLRPRLLVALVLTAIVTLATAALTLLAPLQSQLRQNFITLGASTVVGDKTPLGILTVNSHGVPPIDGTHGLKAAVEQLYHQSTATYVIWTSPLSAGHARYYDTDPDDPAARDKVPPYRPVGQALADGRTHYTLNGNVLVDAVRYRGQPYGHSKGRVFVLETIRHVEYLASANSAVRTAFLYAALVGLVVATVLGVALSSRLVRRLRLLRDASRSLDERELSTLVVPQDTVSDEIGELAQAFATMHERLRQQEDARRAFVATASHELRTPLASLDTMLELLAEDLYGDPVDVDDARARVSLAQVQSRRLAGLAKDLLDLSRIDAKLELRNEPVELVETARAVTAEFDLRAREREVAIVLDQIGDGAWAQADPGSVARIVRILLDNALQVAPSHSMIEVRVSNGAGPPSIEVADEGPGVPDAERELIFERFKRGSERGGEGGFGLGLAIGTELALRMGGNLELTDAHPGATFRLTLPEASD
ncbi:MAG TPA: HAMP domain-containing sensor histidine kinase [Solirubrobacteraceae bacterium]